MNILHIIGQYNETKVYSELVSHLEQFDIQQDVYVHTRGNSNKNMNIQTKKTHILFSKSYNSFDRALFYPRVKKVFADMEEKYDFTTYDIIHAHTFYADGYLAYMANKKYGIPYIATVRTTDSIDYCKYMPHVLIQTYNIVKYAKKIVFLSDTIYKDFRRKFSGKIRKILRDKALILPNGISDYWHKNEALKADFVANTLNFIQVSTFIKRKNVDKTLNIIKYLDSHDVNVHLTIVGKGKEKTKYIKMANDMRLNDIVTFKDFMTQDQLINEYRNSSYFIMPSINETFGLVYVEAMSQGLPIIYKNGTGIDSYVSKINVGIGIDDFDYNKICNDIIKSIKKYPEMSKNALEVSKQFDWNIIVKNLYDVYFE